MVEMGKIPQYILIVFNHLSLFLVLHLKNNKTEHFPFFSEYLPSYYFHLTKFLLNFNCAEKSLNTLCEKQIKEKLITK